jgi:hypothetical protein
MLYKDRSFFYTVDMESKGGCKMNDPRQHVNEEPRNDLIDVGVGFLGMFGLMLVIAVVATVIQVMTR